MTTGKIGVLFQRLTVRIWDFSAAKNIQLVLRDNLIENLSLFAQYWHSRGRADKGSPHNLVTDITVQICMGDMVWRTSQQNDENFAASPPRT